MQIVLPDLLHPLEDLVVIQNRRAASLRGGLRLTGVLIMIDQQNQRGRRAMTAPKHFPPVEFLRECFDYNPKTGLFRWKRRPAHHFVSPRGCNGWNARFAGAPAFDHTNNYGYPTSNLTLPDGEKLQILAHRVAWALMTGEHPPERIDHRDNDHGNARFGNLRPATSSQNGGNRRGRPDKLKGAFWDAEHGRYRAIITIAGKRKHLGRFDTEADAHAAYIRAAVEGFGEFARAA